MIARLALSAGVLLACGAALAPSAFGQPAPQSPAKPAARVSRPPGRSGSWELSASLLGSTASDLGAETATLTPNQTGSATPSPYFSSSARLQAAPGISLRLGFAVTRDVVLEGGMTYSRPGVRLTVDGDIEGAAGFSSTAERIAQYSFEGGVRCHLPRLAFHRGRGRPFAAGSIGYLRQLHEGRTVVETGVIYGAGGGVTYLLAARTVGILPGVAIQGVSVRADARWSVTTRGYSFDGRAHAGVVAGVGLLVGF